MAGSVAKERMVYGVYFDFSKAFDTVSCNSLIDKRSKYGLHEQWSELNTGWMAEPWGLWSAK